MNRVVSVLVVSALGSSGCWLSTPVIDDGAFIACTNDDECPTTHTCVAATRCAPSQDADRKRPELVSLRIEAPPPPQAVAPRGLLRFTAEFGESIREGSEEFLVFVNARDGGDHEIVASVVSIDRRTFDVSATLPLDVTSGQGRIVATVADDFGNAFDRELIGTFTVDGTGPEVRRPASLRITPPVGSLMSSAPSAATRGSRVEVVVAFSEPVDVTRGTLVAISTARTDGFSACRLTDGVELVGEHDELTGAFRLPDDAIGSSLSSGVYALFACLRDQLGNTRSSRLDEEFAVQLAAPGLVVKQDQVVLVRAERGSDVAEPRETLTIAAGPQVVLAPPDTLDGDRIAGDTFVFADGSLPRSLLVWADPARQQLMANIAPLAVAGDGPPASSANAYWPRTTLSLSALATVFVSALDQAGNESAVQALERSERVIVAGPSATGDSRHRLFTGGAGALPASPRADDPGVVEVSAESGAAGLADGVAVATSLSLAWEDVVGIGAIGSIPGLNGLAAQMAFDATRGRVVLLRAFSTTVLEWDGARWRSITPEDPGPLPTLVPAMVYDESVGAMLVVGGGVADPFATWAWDGTTFRLVSVDTPNSQGDQLPSSTYDPIRAATLLWKQAPTGELHELKDGRWTLLRDDGPPTALLQIGFSEATGDVVLFGGADAAYARGLSQTWTFDGTAFEQLEEAGGPPGSIGGTLVYDPRTEELLLIAPATLDNGVVTPTTAVWAFDGTRWRDTQKPLPLNGDAASFGPAVFDPIRKQVLASPGFVGLSLGASSAGIDVTFTASPENGRLFAFDAAAGWTDLTFAPRGIDGSFADGASAFDAARRAVVSFGGIGSRQIVELDVDTNVRRVVDPSVPPPTCGDGILDAGEQCDDGGAAPGEGCDSACQFESPIEVFADDVEALDPRWTNEAFGGATGWSLSAARSGSPVLSLYSGDSNQISAISRLVSPPVDVPAAGRTVLELVHFWQHDDCGQLDFSLDGNLVEVSVEGAPFESLAPAGGYPDFVPSLGAPQPGWGHDSDGVFQRDTLDLSAFAGRQVRVAFTALFDGGNCSVGEGWYVDDIAVINGDGPVVGGASANAAAPPPRLFGALAYSAQEGGVILFGGIDVTVAADPVVDPPEHFNDTWLWDGATWRELCAPASGCIAPPARALAAMIPDEINGGVLLHGGTVAPADFVDEAAFVDFGDTWRFEGGQWTELTVPGAELTERSHVLAQDLANDRLVSLGGTTNAGGNNTLIPIAVFTEGQGWSIQTPVARPSGVILPGLVYDPNRGRFVTFGGANGPQAFNETFFLDIDVDGAEFTPVTVSGPSPPARINDNFFFFDGAVHLIGGLVPGINFNTAFIDHWVGRDADDHAAINARIDLAAEGIDVSSVEAVRLRGRAAGIAADEAGFAVAVFNGLEFVEVTRVAAAPDADGQAGAQGDFEVVLDLTELLPSPVIALQIATLGRRASAAQPVTLALDFLEVRVLHLPARPLLIGEPCRLDDAVRPCVAGSRCAIEGTVATCIAQELLAEGSSCIDDDVTSACDPVAALACVAGTCTRALVGPSPPWTCDPALFGNGQCDCGCGVTDPDCADRTRSSCANCTVVGGCLVPNPPPPPGLPVGCRLINDADNSQCQLDE